MKRFIEKDLLEWKSTKGRLPLIVRGARQVGKSFTIEKFGRENFKTVVIVNFELEPEFATCFESLDPDRIVSRIELMTEKNINDEDTLLFFDEIQQCPKALLSLRYFKEKRPSLNIIAAGSLLEFALHRRFFFSGRQGGISLYETTFFSGIFVQSRSSQTVGVLANSNFRRANGSAGPCTSFKNFTRIYTAWWYACSC